jgi:hypothetical protein
MLGWGAKITHGCLLKKYRIVWLNTSFYATSLEQERQRANSFARKAFIVRGGHAHSIPSRQANRLPTTAEKLGIEPSQLVFIG